MDVRPKTRVIMHGEAGQEGHSWYPSFKPSHSPPVLCMTTWAVRTWCSLRPVPQLTLPVNSCCYCFPGVLFPSSMSLCAVLVLTLSA